MTTPTLQCPCGDRHLETVHTYTAPPACEVAFTALEGQQYHRTLFRCGLCGHFVSRHAMDLGALYEEGYVSANYQDDAGVRRTFEKIMALPPQRSDNRARAARVDGFCRNRFSDVTAPALLDVGSGLCVFPAAMQEKGWACTALDADERLVRHARDLVGVAAVQDQFPPRQPLGRFHLLTFNKVLEHVEDPVAMLAPARKHLTDGGVVYVELPDGQAAIHAGADREEFAIDHHHAFSMASLTLLADRAGLRVLVQERLVEPSGKYTLWAFLEPGA